MLVDVDDDDDGGRVSGTGSCGVVRIGGEVTLTAAAAAAAAAAAMLLDDGLASGTGSSG